jgi:GGDEF domain-containing protein
LRESDIGRSGGDEFIILVDLYPRSDESLTPAQRLAEVIARLSQKFEVFFESLSDLGATAAIGSSLWQAGMSLDELVDLADEDMRLVKSEQHLKYGKHRD